MGYNHTVKDSTHTVKDSEKKRFIINPITRQISNETGKVVLTKLDHNSECFTFEIPATIENHDMSSCNVVEVHFINIDSATRATRADVYPVNDFLKVVKDDGTEVWTFTWLVSQNATQFAGTLNFAVRFACEESDGKVLYSWRTAVFSGITIVDSIFGTEQSIADYSDILQYWWNKIESASKDYEVYGITDDGAILSLTAAITNLQDNTAKKSDLIAVNNALSIKANKEEVVNLSETQTITGSKTFKSFYIGNVDGGYITQLKGTNTASSPNFLSLPSITGTLALTSDILPLVYPVGTVFRTTMVDQHPAVGTWRLLSGPSVQRLVRGTTGTRSQELTTGETVYVVTGSEYIGIGYTEVTISGGSGTPTVAYDDSTGYANWTLYGETENSNVTGQIIATSNSSIYEYERTE